MGVPLHVALRGIERSFDSHAAKPRARSVKSLFYCQEEVEAQFADWLESQRGATPAAQPLTETNGNPAAQATDDTAADARLPFPRAEIIRHLRRVLEEIETARVRALTLSDINAAPLTETVPRIAARLSELTDDFARAVRPDAEALEATLNDLETLSDATLLECVPASVLQTWQTETLTQLQPYRKNMEQELYSQTARNLLLKRARAYFGVPRFSLFHL